MFKSEVKLTVDAITPISLKQELSKYIVGQEDAKKVLSVAIYKHIVRCKHPEANIKKSNILIAGPTGCGKTLMAKTLAKLVNIPMAIADATSLTQAGYVGEDVENCLLRLIQAADGDVNKAERGILFIDEIDKLGRKSESPSITRDVSGEGVQQALLKMIEGSIVNVPASGGRKRPDGVDYIPIDTSNILFICSGAFEGLNVDAATTPDQFVKYGMMPELLGRLPIYTYVEPLSIADLKRILTEPKDSIVSQFVELFRLCDCELKIMDTALDAIAEISYNQHTGARGLQTVLEKVMLEDQYNLPYQHSAIITSDDVYRLYPIK